MSEAVSDAEEDEDDEEAREENDGSSDGALRSLVAEPLGSLDPSSANATKYVQGAAQTGIAG